METRSAKELAVALVSAFGDPDAIAPLLDDEVVWWVTPTIAAMLPGMVGRDMVLESMRYVFGTVYADVDVTVNHAIAEGDVAAVRITVRARALGTVDYENEYSLWVQARDGRIVRVWEYVDMQHATNQLTATEEPPQPLIGG